MNGWSASNYKLSSLFPVSGIVTNLPVSAEFPITAGGSLNIVAKITAIDVNLVGSITAKLQTAIGADWVDVKSVSVTSNGIYYIKLNVQVTADQPHLPLLNKGRVVLTSTNAGDAVTITGLNVLQEL